MVISVSSYAQDSFNQGAPPSKYTLSDSVDNTGIDSFHFEITPYRNSVGFQTNVQKVSGNPALSYIQHWASKMPNPGPGTKGYTLIATDTVRNVSTLQSFNHDINNGRGNPFLHYKQTYQGAGTARCAWQSFSLVR